ncbi:CHAD domain-containing protein [Kitasatospora sp. NPDC088346]|uniref:CHAD domain-containing protein n=1 Tax=Kitasatospora sp. NPDC088346 TaxID=3364073 RepID=UPI0037F9E49E
MPHRRDRTERTAGAVVAARVAELAARLTALAPAVRAEEPDAVHQMRITCRRLRSTLRVFGRLLPDADGGPGAVADELAWLGGALGRARDCEVLGARLLDLARGLPPEDGREDLVADLAEWEREQLLLARPEVLAALDGPRFPALLRALADLCAGPLPSGRARGPAGPELARAVRREYRRTARRVRAAGRATGPGAESALHDVRKAAKRARYTGETAGPDAAAFTAGMKAVQEVLGRHQDAVIAGHTLRGLSDGGFGYGVLYGLQLAEAARAREEFPEAWRRVRRPTGA